MFCSWKPCNETKSKNPKVGGLHKRTPDKGEQLILYSQFSPFDRVVYFSPLLRFISSPENQNSHFIYAYLWQIWAERPFVPCKFSRTGQSGPIWNGQRKPSEKIKVRTSGEETVSVSALSFSLKCFSSPKFSEPGPD